MDVLRRVRMSAANARAESTKGLIVNIGILSVLVLSFSVPLMVSVDMEVFDRLDFQALVMSNQTDFRQFVIYVMDQPNDVTKGFNWEVIVGVEKRINVRAVLVEVPPISIGRSMHMWNVKRDDNNKIMCAVEALIVQFPMWQMRTWLTQQPEIFVSGGSDDVFMYLSVAIGLLTLVTLSSMIYYVSFTLSPTQGPFEGAEHAKGLQRWNMIGIPFILLLYGIGAIGIFFFCSGLQVLVFGYAPRLIMKIYSREVAFYGLCIPLVVLSSGVAVFAAYKSCKAASEQDANVTTSPLMNEMAHR